MRGKLPTILCGLLAAATSGFEPSTRPTSPATQPAGYSISGQVTGNVDLSRAVIYLDSDPLLDAVPIPQQSATVAQKNKEFVPKFLAIPKGTDVEFPNWDHISHNVFSRSAAAPAFDLDRYPYGVSKTRAFTKVGIVQVFCNIHPQMRAMIFVSPNAFLCRADKDGHFQLNNIPPGNYLLVAWQDRCGSQRRAVMIGSGKNPQVTFALSEDRTAAIPSSSAAHGGGYGIERGLGIKHETLNLPVVKESHPALTTEPCPDCK